MQWESYVRTFGDDAFARLWGNSQAAEVLLVVGGGFDPRVPRALRVLSGLGIERLDVLCLALPDDGTEPTVQALATANRNRVKALVEAGGGAFSEQPFPSVHSRRSAGVQISRAFHEAGYLNKYQEVLVDISGLPSSVFFPLVVGILRSAEAWKGNMHIVVCENPDADGAILEEGAETPGALGGFGGPLEEEDWAAKVWLPVLGEGKQQQIAALYESISPQEVIPILPFPASNPRRADALVLEYRELLVDSVEVEPRNYLYASETNPFDLYRSIHRLHERYQSALRPLGAAKFILSTHSSKLLSVGVLLAAHELGLQVMQVSPSRYGLRLGADPDSLAQSGTLTDIWLMGDPYL